MSEPKHDMHERTSLPEDAEAVLSALLAVDPDSEDTLDKKTQESSDDAVDALSLSDGDSAAALHQDAVQVRPIT